MNKEERRIIKKTIKEEVRSLMLERPERMKNFINNFIIDKNDKLVIWKQNQKLKIPFCVSKDIEHHLMVLKNSSADAINTIIKLKDYDSNKDTIVVDGIKVPMSVMTQISRILQTVS